MNIFRYKYTSNSDFFFDNQNAYWLFKEGFVRKQTHMLPSMAEWEINIMNLDDIKELLIRCVPIIGNILGAGKLYSVWSTKDFEDRCQDIIFHTISGALETLGLGVAALILKIVVTGLFYITELLSWIMYKILSSAMSNQQFAERFSFIFPN